MCIDSAAKRGDMHKPVGLYPCHNQGGNQVKLYLLNCLNVTANLCSFCFSFGCSAKMVKFAVMRLAWTLPAMMSFFTHAMAQRATNCGPMMMMSVFAFVNFVFSFFNHVFQFYSWSKFAMWLLAAVWRCHQQRTNCSYKSVVHQTLSSSGNFLNLTHLKCQQRALLMKMPTERTAVVSPCTSSHDCDEFVFC